MDDPIGVGGVPSTVVASHQGGLERSVGFLGHIALVLSDITPTASLLVIGPVVILTAGTGSVLAYVLGGFVAVCIALCMGELGSMYPTAGGLYSIVTNVLGKELRLPGNARLHGAGDLPPGERGVRRRYVCDVAESQYPDQPDRGGDHGRRHGPGAVADSLQRSPDRHLPLDRTPRRDSTAGSGLAHIHQPLSILTQGVVASGNGLAPVTASIVIAALAVALFSVNGYDSAINFSEETTGGAARVGRAVVTAALIGIVFEVIPFVAVVFGAQNLSSFLHSTTPLTDVARDSFGSTFVTIIIWGGILAIFNASLAITLQFARIVWAGGRDRAWPEPVSSWLGKVSVTRRSPWVATLVVGGPGDDPLPAVIAGDRRHVHRGPPHRPVFADRDFVTGQPDPSARRRASVEDADLAGSADHRARGMRARHHAAEGQRPPGRARHLRRRPYLFLCVPQATSRSVLDSRLVTEELINRQEPRS